MMGFNRDKLEAVLQMIVAPIGRRCLLRCRTKNWGYYRCYSGTIIGNCICRLLRNR